MRRMIKRIISSVLLVIMLFTLWGCDIFGNKYPLGYLYTLEEAYEQGMITKDDLKKMAYIHNDNEPHDYNRIDEVMTAWKDEEFVPAQRSAKQPEHELEEKIKESYAEYLCLLPGYADVLTDDVSIYGYCGTYNGYAVVMIQDNYHTYNGRVNINLLYHPINLEPISFIYLNVLPADTSRQGIYAWKEGETNEFYDLETAFDLGLFCQEEMQNIAYYQRQNYVERWSENFIPTDKNSNILSAAIERKIKQTRLDDLIKESNLENKDTKPEYTIDDIGLGNYLGTYGDCVAFSIGSWLMYSVIVIDDVLFAFPAVSSLEVWKENL